MHLPSQSRTAEFDKPNTLTLRLLTYSCRTLGFDQTRLVEIAEDLPVRGVHVAALQYTCWRHDTARHEWVVKNRHGQTLAMSSQELFCCLAALSATRNTSTGGWTLDRAQLVVLGVSGVAYRRSRRPHDHAFVTAYAPQETAPKHEEQAFFMQLQQTIHDVFGCWET